MGAVKTNSKVLLIIIVILAVGGTVTLLAYSMFGRGTSGAQVTLPSGCARPANGYLIIAAYNGFNDSVDRGVPANSWPVISVQKGANVTITVCNADGQPHGFQIAHYYDSSVVILDAGQVRTVSFIADQSGKFQIYCSIQCSIHWAMISGQLRVT
jgi:heme/copper-type cytochrome/quinol oxidase subunit 2